DINTAVNPDILGTITDLSAVPDNSVDGVFSSHNLEHIYHYEGEHLTYAMSINTYRCQQLENLQLDHKEK
ncbi:MAG: hypothetical protein ACK544_03175, partial [Microcystis sp.]